MMSKGILVAREDTAFKYIAGRGISNYVAKDGFHIALYQNGAIDSTGYVLLEKNSAPEPDNIFSAAGKIIDMASQIAGKAAHDYGLQNIETGEVHMLDVSMENKKVGFYSQCRKKNMLVNICDQVDFRESLYDSNGLPNSSDYYWRIQWYNTKIGPLAITLEGTTLPKLYITNLATGKRVLAAERALGINGFGVTKDNTGKLSLTANVGFEKKRIDDIVGFLTVKIAELSL